YTAPFMPDHSTNQSGYACWSGTSFATAVASAWLANQVASSGESPATIIAQTLDYAAKQTADGQATDSQETPSPKIDIIKVKAGVNVAKVPGK
ncbi:MAG: hypothetical protein KDE59_16550, partial [Anaerolineales bacterium]|nr:hypothetical protein [Anaerolineales bacterium]